MQNSNDSWVSGKAYEQFMGRWSVHIGLKFVDWLALSPGSRWLDIGCGTGSLTKVILETRQPKSILSFDSSSEFITYGQQSIQEPIVHFQVGLAQALPLQSSSVDAAVSGFMLNFVPQPETAVAEMIRVTKSGGTVGILLWDYAQGMEMLRYFWDTAVMLNSAAQALDEGARFPLCQEAALAALLKSAGLQQVTTESIEITTIFPNFADYWQPFLGSVGPAPGYTTRLSPHEREALKNELQRRLPTESDGSISLRARAWAAKGIV